MTNFPVEIIKRGGKVSVVGPARSDAAPCELLICATAVYYVDSELNKAEMSLCSACERSDVSRDQCKFAMNNSSLGTDDSMAHNAAVQAEHVRLFFFDCTLFNPWRSNASSARVHNYNNKKKKIINIL